MMNHPLSEVIPLVLLFTIPASFMAATDIVTNPNDDSFSINWNVPSVNVYYPTLWTLALLFVRAIVIGNQTMIKIAITISLSHNKAAAIDVRDVFRSLSSLCIPLHVVGGLFATLWLAGGDNTTSSHSVDWNASFVWIPLSLFGVTFFVWTNLLFVIEGRGTLCPMDPTKRLVVQGPYKYVRNPMICGILCIMLSISFAAPSTMTRYKMLLFTTWFFITKTTYLKFHEEPNLLAQYGKEYKTYFARVNRWIPNWQPYKR